MTTLSIFADYHQIYLCDPAHVEDWSALWNDQTLADRVVACPHTMVFGTGRNVMEPVDVIVDRRQPDLGALAAPADHAVTGGITCASGKLKLAGCTEYLPEAFALDMRAGPVGVMFLSFDLGTIDPVERLDGKDRYELRVWPAETVAPARAIKRWNETGQ